MRVECLKDKILIFPETGIEQAYLEYILNVKRAEDWAEAVRKNAEGLPNWGHLELRARRRE